MDVRNRSESVPALAGETLTGLLWLLHRGPAIGLVEDVVESVV